MYNTAYVKITNKIHSSLKIKIKMLLTPEQHIDECVITRKSMKTNSQQIMCKNNSLTFYANAAFAQRTAFLRKTTCFADKILLVIRIFFFFFAQLRRSFIMTKL